MLVQRRERREEIPEFDKKKKMLSGRWVSAIAKGKEGDDAKQSYWLLLFSGHKEGLGLLREAKRESDELAGEVGFRV